MASQHHLANSHHIYFLTGPDTGGRQLTLSEAENCLKFASLKVKRRFGSVWTLPTKQTIYEFVNSKTVFEKIH